MKNKPQRGSSEPHHQGEINGKTVAEYFGNQGAAIATLANIIKLILKETK